MTICRSKDSDRSGAPTASIVLGDHANSSMIIENLKSSERRDRAIAKKISWFLKTDRLRKTTPIGEIAESTRRLQKQEAQLRRQQEAFAERLAE